MLPNNVHLPHTPPQRWSSFSCNKGLSFQAVSKSWTEMYHWEVATEWDQSESFWTDWAQCSKEDINRCHGNRRTKWGRRREIRVGGKKGKERNWISEHIAHYSPHRSCEIFSQLELAAEVLTACGVAGGVWVGADVCMSTYCCFDTDVTLKRCFYLFNFIFCRKKSDQRYEWLRHGASGLTCRLKFEMSTVDFTRGR